MNESDEVNVDNKKLMSIFKKYRKEAEHVVNDKQKLKDLIKKSRAKIHRLEKLPYIGAVIGDYIDMIDMLVAYIKGEYKKMPISTLISIVATLLYTLSPIDLIADAIPVIGFADDAILIDIVRSKLIGQDLEKFRAFRLKKEIEKLENWIVNILSRDDFADRFLQAIIINEKGIVKALISYEDNEISPIICNLYEADVHLDDYLSLQINKNFANAFRSLFLKCDIKVNKSRNLQIVEEDEFEYMESRYLITEFRIE